MKTIYGVFFCKQKTAYEMRISDWSSDMCYSDLKAAGGADVILDMVGGPYIQRNVDCLKLEGRLVQIAFLQKPVVERFNFLKVMTQRQIGRASCRERVCQYV